MDGSCYSEKKMHCGKNMKAVWYSGHCSARLTLCSGKTGFNVNFYNDTVIYFAYEVDRRCRGIADHHLKLKLKCHFREKCLFRRWPSCVSDMISHISLASYMRLNCKCALKEISEAFLLFQCLLRYNGIFKISIHLQQSFLNCR